MLTNGDARQGNASWKPTGTVHGVATTEIIGGGIIRGGHTFMVFDEELETALASLPALDEATVELLKARSNDVTPVLVQLLEHSDHDWRRSAASAFARMRATPPTAVGGLLKLLGAPSTSGRIAAIAAMDWLPTTSKRKVINAIVRLLMQRQRERFPFTRLRTHMARSVAAHWLALHGGRRGVSALRLASRRHDDPVRHYIESALQTATRPPARRS